MATRFYIPNGGTAAAVSPALSSHWTSNTGSPTRLLLPDVTPTNTTIGTISGSITTFNFRYFMRQYVSRRLNGAQSVTGTKQLILGKCLGVSTSLGYWAATLRVVSEDGTTVRGTLKSPFYPLNYFTTTGTTKLEDATTMTTVSASDGDRIVLELGLANDDSVTRTVQYNIGDNAGSDFAHTDGLTTDLNPWLELSATLSFKDEDVASTNTNQLMMTGCGT